MQLNTDELRERLTPLFQENFEKFGELGAAISVWQNGKELLELHAGFRDARREQPWTKDTLVLIWSATKGLGSACLLHVLQERKIDIEQRVGEFWPEFAQAGKEQITLAQLLSHQAGLAVLDQKVDVLDYAAVINALEKQAPNWPPGTAHGYHARTFGFLLDELVKRISGTRLGEYWRRTFADPLSLDLWIGLPEKENARVATMYAARVGKVGKPHGPKNRQSGSDFYLEVATKGTFPNKVFTSPAGLQAVSEMNKPEIRAQPIVSFDGIGSASSLAKFYAMLANAGSEPDGRLTEPNTRQFFSERTLGWMTTTLSDGIDRVFQIPTAFSAGFMKDSKKSPRKIFGRSTQLPVRLGPFGHPGAGGSHAFADPENKISFAYVMNQMEQSVLPNEKSLRLVDAIYK
ncbi:MAG TPA: serine hydrolase domain-containing protein [Chthoniobacterales bacterium]|jgi:CubicO group peptidase (beta-lactamase class C family)|nr:serine hydrolase domain-containing protein [Chthoniobacterales bacterium]